MTSPAHVTCRLWMDRQRVRSLRRRRYAAAATDAAAAASAEVIAAQEFRSGVSQQFQVIKPR